MWKRDGITSNPPKGFPPEPHNTGSGLEFRWTAGPLGGEAKRQFLKLTFPNRSVIEKSINEIFYSKLLVVGSVFPGYPGRPIRSDWLHAIRNLGEIKTEIDSTIPTVTYRNIEIRGLPVAVDRIFGPLAIKIDSKIAVGLYPDPDRMPKSWKAYRAFVAGSDRSTYVLQGSGYSSILPWVSEFNDGSPGPFAVETENGETGVTFYRTYPEEAQQNGATPLTEISVGIDFGTTNTLVYAAPPNSDPTNLRADQFAIRPAALHGNVSWLAMDARTNATPTVDFLPAANYESVIDPYLIPTAVWVSGQSLLIRWNAIAPSPTFRADGRFKSNPQAGFLRLTFLRELLFLTVPAIAGQAAPFQSEIKLNLGFSFPLAFGYQDRQQMQQLFRDLTTCLKKDGCGADCFSINESRACVRAFGTPRLNEHFLVADMGGGTLDLALFTTGEDETKNIMHQIGSLRYAGEDYVESFARSEAERWDVKDAIADGKSVSRYGRDPRAQKVLQKFVGFAFEYLRTMLAAFKRGRENDAIKVVLVGNGWHLANSFSPDTKRSPQQVFKETYEHLLKQLGVKGVELYLDDPLPTLPSSKHLVVMGALRNAWGGQATRELESSDSPMSKLPSGRGMSLGRVDGNCVRFQWHDLVGEGLPLEDHSVADLKADSEFFFNELPDLATMWQQHFLNLFGCSSIDKIPHLAEGQIREQIYESIQGIPPNVGKGPLQVILEQSWKPKLSD